MFVKVHKSVSTPACSNKGSCALLAAYLEKENAGKAAGDRMAFFDHEYDTVSKGHAVAAIDGNIRNLGRNDAKFFMLTINPSHKELQHLIKHCTGKEGVTDFSQLQAGEQQKVYAQLRDYSRKVMDLYAQNINRPQVRNGADLVYFAKIEVNRKWKATDQQVREGKAVAGSLKEGLNLHVHVVVSRNDRSQTTKLSPQSRSRGGKQQLNGKAVEQGFNHELFKTRAGELFRERYNYRASSRDQYEGRGAAGAGTAMAGGYLKGQVTAVARRELTQGHFQTEQQVLGRVQQGAQLVKALANPKAAAVKLVTQKVLAILKGGPNLEL